MASILLVEDNNLLREMLVSVLTESGYDVSESPDGARVGDMYQRQRFDLVITDVVMPDIEGLGVIMELRRLDQNVRIIAMSGGGQSKGEDYLKMAEKLGAQITLAKPFTNEQFLNAVSSALGSQTQNHVE